jgi:uncharacterized membrane protein YdjX (TVP38/TMEM64 family)
VPLLSIALPLIGIAYLAANIQRFPIAAQFIEYLRTVAYEWWAVPVFLALYVVCALFMMPVTLLSAAGALAWGWKVGGAIELLGVMLGALAPFHLARRGLAPALSRFLARRGFVLDPLPPRRETFVFLLLRIVTVIPYVALNYIAGLARIRKRDYLWTTFVGSIPSVFLFAWFVDTVGTGATTTRAQLRIAAACTVVAVVAVLMKMGATWLRQHLLSQASAAPPPDDDDPRCASPEPPPE